MSENQVDVLMKFNCSTIFLLSPLDLNRHELMKHGFIEAYLVDEYCTETFNMPVFLLFEPKDTVAFNEFIENEYLRKNKFTGTIDLVKDYDRGEGKTVLVYEFPKTFESDFVKFKKGQYSKFSESIKKTYPKMIGNVPAAQYRIITKDSETEALVVQKLGQSYIINNPIVTIADMLEERFGTYFDESMELWQKPRIEKETLKI